MNKRVFALVGRTLDRASQAKGRGPQRFKRRWRPSVALARFDVISHLHLIASNDDLELAVQIKEDAESLNPDLHVEINEVAFDNPWDLPSTFLSLLTFVETATKELPDTD